MHTSSSSKSVVPFSIFAPMPLSKLLYRSFTRAGRTPSSRSLEAQSKPRANVSIAPARVRNGVNQWPWQQVWMTRSNLIIVCMLCSWLPYIHTNVRDEHVVKGSGLATRLAVKVETTRSQATLLNHSLGGVWMCVYESGSFDCWRPLPIQSSLTIDPLPAIYLEVRTFIINAAFLTSMGNWSVSQPRSGDPVLESIEPSMPSLDATTTSCSWPWPARVVWLGSIFSCNQSVHV